MISLLFEPTRAFFRITLISIVSGTILYGTPVLAWQNPNYNSPYPYYPAPTQPNAMYYQPRAQMVRYSGYYYPPQPAFVPPQPRYPAAFQAPYYPIWPNQAPTTDTANQTITKPAKVLKVSIPETSPKIIKPPENGLKKQSGQNKKDFIDRLLPSIKQENKRLSQLRIQLKNTLSQLESNQLISKKSKQWLKNLSAKYRVKGNPLVESEARTDLLEKIDIIPTSLALAQAANESAWGKSRFAVEANNLFGIWTYDEKNGLKPLNRDEGDRHLVRKFNHYSESVAYYMHTLNSHPAYQKLRHIRQQSRQQQRSLDGHSLAEGLEKYSALGEQYVTTIQSMIRQNKWARLDSNNQSV